MSNEESQSQAQDTEATQIEGPSGRPKEKRTRPQDPQEEDPNTSETKRAHASAAARAREPEFSDEDPEGEGEEENPEDSEPEMTAAEQEDLVTAVARAIMGAVARCNGKDEEAEKEEARATVALLKAEATRAHLETGRRAAALEAAHERQVKSEKELKAARLRLRNLQKKH